MMQIIPDERVSTMVRVNHFRRARVRSISWAKRVAIFAAWTAVTYVVWPHLGYVVAGALGTDVASALLMPTWLVAMLVGHWFLFQRPWGFLDMGAHQYDLVAGRWYYDPDLASRRAERDFENQYQSWVRSRQVDGFDYQQGDPWSETNLHDVPDFSHLDEPRKGHKVS